MKVRIEKIVTVHMGYTFRTRLEMVEGGNVVAIQMKNIDKNSQLNEEDLVSVNLPKVKDVHLVRKGDVLFRSRGRINTATLVDNELGEVVAAAPLLRIRLKRNKVLPEYLAWYINQPGPQAYLDRQASGTISRMINKRVIEEMEVELPSLERQEQIVAIEKLAAREQDLLRKLAEKRKAYLNGMLMKLAVKG